MWASRLSGSGSVRRMTGGAVAAGRGSRAGAVAAGRPGGPGTSATTSPGAGQS